MSARMSRRLLLVSASNFERDNRVLKMAKALHEAGWDVTCLGMVTKAGDRLREERDYATFIRVVTSSVPYAEAAAAEASSGVAPPRTPLRRRMLAAVSRVGFVDDLRHFFGRVRENVLFSGAVRDMPFDAVLVCNPAALLAGVLVKRRQRIPLVYDVREVWTGQAADVRRLHRWLYDTMERVLVRRADRVTAVNELIGQRLAERYGVAEPLAVYNGAEECLGPTHPVGAPLRLFFQGRFTADRGLVPLVGLAPRLRGRATLTLQGFEGVERELHELVETLGVSDVVTFVPPCDAADVVKDASAYDVGLISYPPTSLNLQLSSPNKLFDYLGAGLAVASSDVPFCRGIIERYDCGVVFDARDPERMLAALLELADRPEDVERMRRNTVRACEETSWRAQAAKLAALLEDLAPARAVEPAGAER